MHLNITTEPFRATLFGYSGNIVAGDVPAAGKPLMDRLWNEVKTLGIATRGVNHWVYLPKDRIFTGVELVDPLGNVGSLEKLDVSLERYVQHRHVGPYAELPHVWSELSSQLKRCGEQPRFPGLEVYGHWNPDPARCETTILLAVEPVSTATHV